MHNVGPALWGCRRPSGRRRALHILLTRSPEPPYRIPGVATTPRRQEAQRQPQRLTHMLDQSSGHPIEWQAAWSRLLAKFKQDRWAGWYPLILHRSSED